MSPTLSGSLRAAARALVTVRLSVLAGMKTHDGGVADNMIDILVNNQPGSITAWS
jgi:hypothetical protein